MDFRIVEKRMILEEPSVERFNTHKLSTVEVDAAIRELNNIGREFRMVLEVMKS